LVASASADSESERPFSRAAGDHHSHWYVVGVGHLEAVRHSVNCQGRVKVGPVSPVKTDPLWLAPVETAPLRFCAG